MSTTSVDLPVVAGAVGAAADVSFLAAKKTFVFSDITGVIRVEARLGAGNWCEIFSTTPGQNDVVFTVVADELRVDATNGGASSAVVGAERSALRAVELPAPAGPNQAGATVDITELGGMHTAYAAALDDNAAAELQISQDGTNFSQAGKSFTIPDCLESLCFDANYARVFARGGNVGAMQLGAEIPAGETLSQPHYTLVYRPEATGSDAPGGNVYTDWPSLYAAVEALRPFGRIIIEFDAKFSSVVTPSGPGCLIPARPDPNNPGSFLRWSMDKCIWTDSGFGTPDNTEQVAPTILFADNCEIEFLQYIYSTGIMYLYHDGTVNSPLIGGTVLAGNRVDLYNSDPLALPMFTADSAVGLFVIASQAQNCRIGTTDPASAEAGLLGTSAAPLFDVLDTVGVFFFTEGLIADNIIQSDAFGLVIEQVFADGPQGLHTYTNPANAAFTAVIAQVARGGQWMFHNYVDAPGTGFSSGVLQTLDFTAKYNSVGPVDTTLAPLTATFPVARPAMGEIVVLHDVGGACGENPVTVIPTGLDTIESPFLATSGGTKAWICDGIGNWRVLYESGGITAVAAAELLAFNAKYDTAHVVDTTAGGFAATLPAASLGKRTISFVNVGGANALTVTPAGGDAVVGAASVSFGTSVRYVSDGSTNWVQA